MDGILAFTNLSLISSRWPISLLVSVRQFFKSRTRPDGVPPSMDWFSR